VSGEPHAPGAATGPRADARARQRRRQRAAVGERLMAHAPAAAAELDWDALDAAPDWLAWPEAQALALQYRVGALLCAPTIRLWIDAPRLAATARAVGAEYLQALLSLPDQQVLPRDLADCPRIDRPEQVAPLLRAAGAAVMLAALPAGPLRRAVASTLAPITASPMAGALAESLVARAQRLAAQPVAPARQAVAPAPSEVAA
jgi:hypothetical protein